jgi:hypothetical protein
MVEPSVLEEELLVGSVAELLGKVLVELPQVRSVGGKGFD